MAANPIQVKTLVSASVFIVAIELGTTGFLSATGLSHLLRLGIIRGLQIAGLLILVQGLQSHGLIALGLRASHWVSGVRVGALWSLGMAAAALAGMGVLFAAGHDPLAFIRTQLPTRLPEVFLFFLVGGLLGPIAEELFFRGLLYTFFRRWGWITALVISTTFFVMLHAPQGVPLVQMVGGLVFAVAYETSRNLIVPMVIHIAGNCAIFMLSLLLR